MWFPTRNPSLSHSGPGRKKDFSGLLGSGPSDLRGLAGSSPAFGTENRKIRGKNGVWSPAVGRRRGIENRGKSCAVGTPEIELTNSTPRFFLLTGFRERIILPPVAERNPLIGKSLGETSNSLLTLLGVTGPDFRRRDIRCGSNGFLRHDAPSTRASVAGSVRPTFCPIRWQSGRN